MTEPLTLDRAKAIYRRTWVSFGDFMDAAGALNASAFIRQFFKDAEGTTAHHALIAYAVVAYARPFKGSKSGGGKASKCVTVAELGLALSPSLAKLHKFLLDIRDKVVAHSDFDWVPIEPEGPHVAYGKSVFQYVAAVPFLEFRQLASIATEGAKSRMAGLEAQFGEALFSKLHP